MKTLKAICKRIKGQEGYGTVELLILVAALGVLAVAITSSVSTELTKEDGATSKIGSTVSSLLDEAAGN